MDLQELSELVSSNWLFTEEYYPALKGLSEKERRLFSLWHILMHQVKAAGKLSAAIEREEHGILMDEENLRLATRNFLLNTIRLADVANMNMDELEREVGVWISDKHQP